MPCDQVQQPLCILRRRREGLGRQVQKRLNVARLGVPAIPCVDVIDAIFLENARPARIEAEVIDRIVIAAVNEFTDCAFNIVARNRQMLARPRHGVLETRQRLPCFNVYQPQRAPDVNQPTLEERQDFL